MENFEDIEIIAQILGGKKNLYRLIVEKYQNPIFSFMLRFAGTTPSAEELTQETFMKAYSALKRFDTQKNFFPWLYTIGLNTARDWKRKDKRQPRNLIQFSEDLNTDEDGASQESLLTLSEDIVMVQKGLAVLAPDYREAVMLRFKYDLSIKEISDIFNISSSAAKMRIHRGLKQLKKVMCHERE